jgi:hypothetical protein
MGRLTKKELAQFHREAADALRKMADVVAKPSVAFISLHRHITPTLAGVSTKWRVALEDGAWAEVEIIVPVAKEMRR